MLDTMRGSGPKATTVLCAGAMRPILEAALPAFHAKGQSPVTVEYTRSGLVGDRARAGEHFDVVITTRSALESLLVSGLAVAGSAVALGHSGIGVAVRAGAPHPRIDTVPAFVRMLKEARSIAYADPASGSPSGIYLIGMLERLGLAAEMAPKTRLAGAHGGHVVVVADMVAGGEAEVAVQQISELLPVAGVEVVGALPSELQHLTTFSAAVGARATDAETARRLVAFLASEAVAPILSEKGMIPA
ncbi:MAG: substrate-binding domain-containing protein [Hyphomicrobiales bacterium]|nr:substrate-binding domain-containing protein [Hyphomicrobiales bacterium]